MVYLCWTDVGNKYENQVMRRESETHFQNSNVTICKLLSHIVINGSLCHIEF